MMNTEIAELIIRDAYSLEARRDGEWVSLTTIRNRAAIDRVTFDKTIKAMDRQQGINVVPADDQKALTRADREAAVMIGGTSNHMIQIQW